jgi:uncharacterized membrane protein
MAVAGVSQRAIAEKYKISQKTVSLILKQEKNAQKVSKQKKAINDVENEERKDNKVQAHNVINTIIAGLNNDLQKASLKDKRELLKTLVELFGMPESKDDDKIEKIEVEFEDASGETEN